MGLCTNGSCDDYQCMASTLSPVTHAGSSRMTWQLGHLRCSWARLQKSMAPSEMERRQRNTSKSFYCQPPPVLPSPTSSWYQTVLRLTNSICLSLGSKSSHKAICASDSPRCCNDDTTISETGSLWTGESSLPHMMLWWSCLPIKSYSNVFLIPLLPGI